MYTDTTRPLNMNFSEVKVGECGPIYWIRKGTSLMNEIPQFSKSVWNYDKYHIQQIVQSQILQSRMAGLIPTIQKSKKTGMRILFIMMIVIAAFFITVLINAPSEAKPMIIGSFIVFELFPSLFMCVLCCKSGRKQNDNLILSQVQIMNAKFNQRSMNIRVCLKRNYQLHNGFDINTLEVYERIYS